MQEKDYLSQFQHQPSFELTNSRKQEYKKELLEEI